MGLTVSDAFRMMMNRIAAEKALPFSPLVPNAETIAAMEEHLHGPLPRFNTIEELMADLNADD
jgi:DNA-damage-inducible protein J